MTLRSNSTFGPAHLFLLSCILFRLQIAAEDWPQWRGPHFDGISREKSWTTSWPKEGPKQVWIRRIGTGFSSMAVSDGRVVAMGNEGNRDTVFCFDEKTGAELWKHAYPCDLLDKYYDGGPGSTPAVNAGKVFTLSKKGDVFCFELMTGKVVWSKNVARELEAKMPTWGFGGSPLVQGTLLILNIGTSGTALDMANGKVVWSNGRGPAGYATPVPFQFMGKPAIAMLGASELVTLDPARGTRLWSIPWVTDYDVNASDPIIQGDKVVLSSSYGTGAALFQVSDGKARQLWKNKLLLCHFNPPILIDGHLYAISGTAGGKADLRCVELASGTLKWSDKTPGYGSLTASDGKLVVLGEKGELMVAEASPAGFKPIARAQILGGRCWTTPVLANGRLYARNAMGNLVCVDLTGK